MPHNLSKLLYLLLISMMSTVIDSSAEDTLPQPIRIWREISFLEDERREKLDIYLPATPPPEDGYPAVVLIHGGGFGSGSKDAPGNIALSLRLAEAGFVVANIDYILATKTKRSWPTALYDCKNAVRFLRANAHRYHVATERISVLGASAGGQLALLTGLTTSVPQLQPSSPYPDVSDSVYKIVNLFGGTNFLTRRIVGSDGEPTDKPFYATAQGLLGSMRPEDHPERWRQASPVFHVHTDSPPVLTIHGKQDKAVDYHQATELAAALDGVGAPNKLILVPDLGHGFGTKGMPNDIFNEILDFLKQ